MRVEEEKRRWTDMARIKVEAVKPYEVIIEEGTLTKAAEYIA